jgi:23S rRNA (adenine2503-C2)-methyltransferase
MNYKGTVISENGSSEHAIVHILQYNDPERYIEFVVSLDPRFDGKEKWCGNVSVSFGCPVSCLMCDAGHDFLGHLSEDEIFEQIDRIFEKGASLWGLDTPKIKLHFARMGEPALNPSFIPVLEKLKNKYPVKGLLPAVATIAPKGSENFFFSIGDIKDRDFQDGRFQLQLSINSSDDYVRDELMPFPKLSLAELGKVCESFFRAGDRKIVLNFALAENIPVSPCVIADVFDKNKTIIKLTPVNPTDTADKNGLKTKLSNT